MYIKAKKEFNALKEIAKYFQDISIKFRQLRSMRLKNSVASTLTDRELWILERINLEEGKTISDLADESGGISYATFYATLKKMEKNIGLLKRNRLKSDNRFVVVRLTKKGKIAVNQYQKIREDIFHELIAAFDLSREDEMVFSSILKRGVENLDKFLGKLRSGEEKI